MKELISRAPLTRRIGNKILPISTADEFYPIQELGLLFRTVDASQTVMQGQIDDVQVPCTVIDNDAAFTPDLVGKCIYRLNATSGTDAGDCLRAPDGANAQAIILSVVSATTLILSFPIFRKNVDSMYYAIDNHTGKVTEWVKGITTSASAGKLIDSAAAFTAGMVGKYVVGHANAVGEIFRAKITAVDSATQLTIDYNHFTAANMQYMIIITDDAYRYIASPNAEITNTQKLRMQVIIKNGTYYEGNILMYANASKRSSLGEMFFVGDRNWTGVIISGAYANATTTKSRTNFAICAFGDFVFQSLKFEYFGPGTSQAVIVGNMIATMTMANCYTANSGIVMLGGRECYMNHSGGKIEAIADGILFGAGSMLRFTGTVEIVTANTKICAQYSFNNKLELSATLTGAGSTDIGYAFDVDIRYVGGVTNWTFSGTSAFRREGYFGTNNTAATATAGAAALPANPEGFIVIYVNGVQKKIPYYTA